MRDGLVAGDGERALQRAGGADDLGGHALTVYRGEDGVPIVVMLR
jgi:hypothetical protein